MRRSIIIFGKVRAPTHVVLRELEISDSARDSLLLPAGAEILLEQYAPGAATVTYIQKGAIIWDGFPQDALATCDQFPIDAAIEAGAIKKLQQAENPNE